MIETLTLMVLYYVLMPVKGILLAIGILLPLQCLHCSWVFGNLWVGKIQKLEKKKARKCSIVQNILIWHWFSKKCIWKFALMWIYFFILIYSYWNGYLKENIVGIWTILIAVTWFATGNKKRWDVFIPLVSCSCDLLYRLFKANNTEQLTF